MALAIATGRRSIGIDGRDRERERGDENAYGYQIHPLPPKEDRSFRRFRGKHRRKGEPRNEEKSQVKTETEMSNLSSKMQNPGIRLVRVGTRPTGLVALGAAITAIEHFVRGFLRKRDEAGITRA